MELYIGLQILMESLYNTPNRADAKKFIFEMREIAKDELLD